VTGTSLFGRVKLFHVREDILQPNFVIDQAKLQSMSRLGGISYGRYRPEFLFFFSDFLTILSIE
jgi:hypothetical protein